MASNKHAHKTAIFEDGTHAVLRFDPADPHRMELIAIFYQAAHAQDYVRLHAPAERHQEKKQPTVTQATKRAPKRTSPAKPVQAPKAKSKPLPAAAPNWLPRSGPKGHLALKSNRRRQRRPKMTP
jgi:hypothetical protein